MKRIFVCAIALLLTLCSATAAFAASTPDEAKTVNKLELKTAPEKLTYELFSNEETDEAGFTVDGNKLTDSDLAISMPGSSMFVNLVEEEMEALAKKVEFFLNINMDGAEVFAEYADGAVEKVDNSELDVTVTNPASFSEIFNKHFKGVADLITKYSLTDEIPREDVQKLFSAERAFAAEVCRDYTVKLSYKNASATFDVRVFTLNGEWAAYEEDDRAYEFVSYSDPKAPRTYVLSKDFYQGKIEQDLDSLDDWGNPIDYYHFNNDTVSGVSVTLKNKETGELITLDNTDIFIYAALNPENLPASGELNTYASVFMESEEQYYVFDYPINFVNDLNTDAESSTYDEIKVDDSKATADTAPLDGSPIKTGEGIAIAVAVLVLISSGAVTYFFCRKMFS